MSTFSFQSLTVYLGSGGRAAQLYKDQADALGALIAQADKQLIYGGMNAGLMGILARSALRAGGAVTGIIPQKIQDSERVQEGLTRTILVQELCDRKRLMFEECDAVIVMPGGFGTLDEALEVLYWGAQKHHSKPLVFVNINGYWDPVLAYLKGADDYDTRYCMSVSDVSEVFTALAAWQPLEQIDTPAHMPHFEDEITRLTDQPIIIDRPSVENAYFAVCALGLKQLAKHERSIGFLNDQGQFDALIEWARQAQAEHFITDKCLALFDHGADEERLRETLKSQRAQFIDLHAEKWGE